MPSMVVVKIGSVFCTTAAATGTVVGDEMTRYGVLLISVVLPCNPGGAWESGIVVCGTKSTVLPPTIEEAKIPPGFGSGLDAGFGSVVAEGTERNVVPPITVTLPWSPEGA